MQSLLRLLRTGLARFAIPRRPTRAWTPDQPAPSREAQPSAMILSYDNFR